MFKIAISTYIANEPVAIPRLIKQLTHDTPISPKDVYVFSGGQNASAMDTKYGVNYLACDHNSYDHTALIGILDSQLEDNWWFVMHDTCGVGPRFFHKLHEVGKQDSHMALLEEGWLNIGQFSPDFLTSARNYILSLRNCTKMQAIFSEKMYRRFSDGKFYCKSGQFRSLGMHDIYENNTPRSVLYFPSLDLYKYQSYHDSSELMNQLKARNMA